MTFYLASLKQSMGGAEITAVAITTLIFYVLEIIAWWKMFEKAGEKGWKSLIPVYNFYIYYKISWKTSWFFVALILSIAYGILGSATTMVPAAVATICSLICAILDIIQSIKLSKSFGHGVPFGLGVWLIQPVFLMIVGFGKSEYKGPQA